MNFTLGELMLSILLICGFLGAVCTPRININYHQDVSFFDNQERDGKMEWSLDGIVYRDRDLDGIIDERTEFVGCNIVVCRDTNKDGKFDEMGVQWYGNGKLHNRMETSKIERAVPVFK